MLLNIASIIDRPGESAAFSESLDLSDLSFSGVRMVPEPVEVKGRVENRAGVLRFKAELRAVLHCRCDRCAKDILRDVRQEVEAILVSEETDDSPDNAFALRGNLCDTAEIVTTAFILEMPSKFLCKEDCAGLCPGCGADLNEGPCACKPETDPRFAVLSQLLEGE